MSRGCCLGSCVRFGLLAAVVIAGVNMAAAQEEPPAKGKKSDVLYQVPETKDPAVLVDFLRRLQSFEPKTDRQAAEYEKRAPEASKAAAEKILELVQDKKSEHYRVATYVLLGNELQDIMGSDDAKKIEATIEKGLQTLATAEIEQDEVNLLIMMADVAENGAPVELAVKLLPKIATALARCTDEEIKTHAELLRGAVRRLQLPGNVLNLKGKTFEGKDFDLASLKGKVVLVDFWATWCGFCIAEFPHLKELRKAYAGKFEIVGLSVDEDREALADFLKQNKLPWIVLHDQENAGEHPALREFGISGYPTVMLVGTDGKVVSLEARGEELDEHLKKLLGPPPEEEKDKDEK